MPLPNTSARPDGRYHSLTIWQALERITKNEIVLPLVQRNFVWNTERVTRLFDSILMGYPISSMLFWDVAPANAQQVRMYRFIKDFTKFQRTPPAEYNGRHINELVTSQQLTATADVGQLLAVLDGQQRLTSLYMGLCGSHATKDPNVWNDNAYNFPPRQLYLRLGDSDADPQGLEAGRYRYQLAWRRQDPTHYREPLTVAMPPFRWYPARAEVWVWVGCVMQADPYQPTQWASARVADLTQQLASRRVAGDQAPYALDEEELETIQDTFERLHRAVYQEQHISYFLLGPENTLGQAVETFVRINRGGMELDYTDMLFALLGANWQHRDVREEVNGLEDKLQQLDGRFDKRFILKSALVMVADRNPEFTLNQFTPTYVRQMEVDWDSIAQALHTTVRLLAPSKPTPSTTASGLHFFSATALAYALAYYHYKALQQGYQLDQRDERRMRQWLVRAQLMWWHKQANTETKLRHLIQVIANYFGEEGRTDFSFPFEQLQAAGLVSGAPTLRVQQTAQPGMPRTGLVIEDLLGKYIGEPGTKFLLALLQEDVVGNTNYDIDHCYPNANAYSVTEQEKSAYPGHDVYSDLMQQLPNLQLLTDSENRSKSDTQLYEWLAALPQQAALRAAHIIPIEPVIEAAGTLAPYQYRRESFQVFFQERTNLLKLKLQQLLQAPD